MIPKKMFFPVKAKLKTMEKICNGDAPFIFAILQRLSKVPKLNFFKNVSNSAEGFECWA